MKKPQRPPLPPRPDLVRRPSGRFGWLEHSLLLDGWLKMLGADGMSVLILLVLAADRHGASFYSRSRMAAALGIDGHRIDAGLNRLLDLQLVDFRPWKRGGADGVWQLLPVPARHHDPPRHGDTLSASQILAALGFIPPSQPESAAG